jgi:hypothetical protein
MEFVFSIVLIFNGIISFNYSHEGKNLFCQRLPRGIAKHFYLQNFAPKTV